MKIVDILKARWPEAVMVAGLQACCVALGKDMYSVPQPPPEADFARLFFLGIGAAIFSIISQMLFWGFLRSVAVDGARPVEPIELLRTGRSYFWRILLFLLLLLPVIVLITLVIQVGGQRFLYGKVIPQPVLWLSVVGDTTARLILIKPFFLIPVIILLRDCGIWDALRNLRQIRMLKMQQFMTIAVSVLVVVGGVEYISGLVGRKDILYYPALALDALISAAGMLVVFLAAVAGIERQMPRDVPDAQTGSEINES